MTTLPKPADSPLPDITVAASAAGLIDIAYATVDSPLGRLLLASTPRGLIRLAYLDAGEEEEATLAKLATKVSPRILASPAQLDEPRRELDRYFSGRLREFKVPIDWSLTRGFGQRVLKATAQVPFGSLTTYQRVATEAGSPRAYRAAGNALGANPIPIIVPCHRVVHATGGLGGYTGGLERKRVLLAIESGQQTLG